METDLYLPVKNFLESAGYLVKGEIAGCDLVAMREGEPDLVVICELKLSFNLELVLQAVERATASDEVWLAALASKKGKGREGDRRFRDLCRRLGFGMLLVLDHGHVEVVVAPESPMPRKNTRRRSRLVAEYQRRRGDPHKGGSTRAPIMTAYRQQALACAALLAAGNLRPRDLRTASPKAATILRSNVYGWFERVEHGIYGLTPAGHEALLRWPQPSMPHDPV